jgi:hypothetical protein
MTTSAPNGARSSPFVTVAPQSPVGPDKVRVNVHVSAASSRPNLRFVVVSLLPTMGLVAFLAALAWSQTTSGPPTLEGLWTAAGTLGLGPLTGLVLLAFLVALLTHPFQISLVRLLEGYWSAAPGLARVGVAFHHRHRDRLETTLEEDPQTEEEARRWQRAARRLALYPREDRLLPTRLGNVMRASEDEVDERYGLDAVMVWPLLYPHVPAELARALAVTRNQLDMYVRLCITGLAAALASAATFLEDGIWLSVPVAAALLAWIAYLAAIRVAMMYGQGIRVAFALHRFDMLRGMHVPLPGTRAEELELNEQLCEFIQSGRPLYGDDSFHRYDHASAASLETSRSPQLT